MSSCRVLQSVVITLFLSVLTLPGAASAECQYVQADGEFQTVDRVDLQVSAFMSSQAPVYPGVEFEFLFQVSNGSDNEAARSPALSVTVPEHVTITGWRSDDGSECRSRTAEMLCTLPDIGQIHAPKNYRDIYFTAVSAVGGALTFTGAASADGEDYCTDNNSEVLTVPVIEWEQIIDLSLTVDLPASVKTLELGESSILPIQVINNHNENTSKSAYLHIPVVDGLNLRIIDGCINVQDDAGFQASGYQCEVGDIAPGGSAAVSIEVTANDVSATAGTFALSEIVFSTSSNGHDYFPRNNSGRALIFVALPEQGTETAPIHSQSPGIDLQINVLSSRELDTVAVGEVVPLVIEIRNNHALNTATAPKISFKEPLNVHVNFENDCIRWGGHSLSVRYHTVVCTLRDIPAGDSILIETQAVAVDSPLVSTNWPRPAVFQFQIFANEEDAYIGNNSYKYYAVMQGQAPSKEAPEPPVRPVPRAGGGGSFGLWITLFLLLAYREHADTRIASRVRSFIATILL